jgi:uncharacterized protein YuzE
MTERERSADKRQAPSLRVRYDRAADVLYLTRAPGVPARSREEQPGMVWRYDVERGELVGVTIVDFAAFWHRRRPELIEQIAGRFHMPREEARSVLDSVDQ